MTAVSVPWGLLGLSMLFASIVMNERIWDALPNLNLNHLKMRSAMFWCGALLVSWRVLA